MSDLKETIGELCRPKSDELTPEIGKLYEQQNRIVSRMINANFKSYENGLKAGVKMGLQDAVYHILSMKNENENVTFNELVESLMRKTENT